MERFNIIVWSDDEQYDHIIKAIPTEGLEFLPRLAGYEDVDFVIGQYNGECKVWHGELGLLLVSGLTKSFVENALKKLLYDLGRVEYYKAVEKTKLFLLSKNIQLPVNDPSVLSQLNYKFEYESNH